LEINAGKPMLFFLWLSGSLPSLQPHTHNGAMSTHSPTAIPCLISLPPGTTATGHAESAAAILLSAGEPGHRCASVSSRVMIHQPALSNSQKITADAVRLHHPLARLHQALLPEVEVLSNANLPKQNHKQLWGVRKHPSIKSRMLPAVPKRVYLS